MKNKNLRFEKPWVERIKESFAEALAEVERLDERCKKLEAQLSNLEASTLAGKTPQAYMTREGVLKISPDAMEYLKLPDGGGVVFVRSDALKEYPKELPKGLLLMSNDDFVDIFIGPE